MNGWIETPWDSRALGVSTYELTDISLETLMATESVPGHFTARVPPLASKRWLHEYGFYYCDTLIEPFCKRTSFKPVFHEHITARPGLAPEVAKRMCQGAFQYDRFHRDFHIPNERADRRYIYWIDDIAEKGVIYGLWFKDESAGFFACEENRILLHALVDPWRGKGLAKFFWSAACQALFDVGYEELRSSVSSANLAVVNLYRSIGFSFRHPVDLYHKFNPPKL